MSSGYGEFSPELTALAFFHPQFTNSKQILELVDMLDTFSSDHLDIEIKGFVTSSEFDDTVKPPYRVTLKSKTYFFTSEQLFKDVKKFEAMSTWKFSMEIDLILLERTRWYNKHGGGVRYNFSNAIVFNLHKMLHEKKLTSLPTFFSELIHFAEDYTGDNPVWDISDAKLLKEIKKSLFESFRKFIGMRKFQRKVEDYAVKDISKQT